MQWENKLTNTEPGRRCDPTASVQLLSQRRWGTTPRLTPAPTTQEREQSFSSDLSYISRENHAHSKSLPNVIGKWVELPQQRSMVENPECWTLSSTGTCAFAHTRASHSFATQYCAVWCLTSMTSEPIGLLTINVCRCKRMTTECC